MPAVRTSDKKTSKQTFISKLNQSDFLVWFALFCLFCSVIYLLRSVLLPFVLGIILGYLFDPLAVKFEKLGASRTIATVFVFLLLTLIAVPLVVLLFSMISNQLSIFADSAPKYISSLTQKIEELFGYLQQRFPTLETENIGALVSQNITQTFKFSGKIMTGLMKNGAAVINIFSLLLITPVVAFYMLRDWGVFVQKIKTLLPQKSRKDIQGIFSDIDRAISGFLRGQLSVCVILGTFYGLSLNLIGLELGLLVGFISGIISFIPYVGSITGFILSIILATSQYSGYTKVIEVIVIFVIGQFFEGNFLTPKLVGDKIGLHPVWVMFALLSGGVLLGFLGLMVAVPIAAIIGILLRFGIKKYKKSQLYLGD